MGVALIHAYGQTDMTKAVGATSDYADVPKNFYYCILSTSIFLPLTRLDAYAGVISSVMFTNVPCLGLRYLSLCTGLHIVLVSGLCIFACWVLCSCDTHTHTHRYICVCVQRNILNEIRKRKANWIGHILRRNCLLQRVTEGNIQGGIEVTGRQGRRRRKLLDDLKEREDTLIWKRKLWIALFGELALEEALDLS
jgi:hypothetical protein